MPVAATTNPANGNTHCWSPPNVMLNTPFVTAVNGATVAAKEKVPVAPVAVSVARVIVPANGPSSSGPGSAGIQTPASSASEYVPTTAGTVTTPSWYRPVKPFVPRMFNRPSGKADVGPSLVTQT
jgi:hypothetical protein